MFSGNTASVRTRKPIPATKQKIKAQQEVINTGFKVMIMRDKVINITLERVYVNIDQNCSWKPHVNDGRGKLAL